MWLGGQGGGGAVSCPLAKRGVRLSPGQRRTSLSVGLTLRPPLQVCWVPPTADTPPGLRPASSPASGPVGRGSPPLSPGVTSGDVAGLPGSQGLLRRALGVWTVVTPLPSLHPDAQGLPELEACARGLSARLLQVSLEGALGPAASHLPGVQREFGQRVVGRVSV